MLKNNNSYVIDYSTKNKSFLVTYVELKELGITNNKFFLRLYDEDLKKVDPFDRKLLENNKTSKIIRLKIMKEIKRNPWYFFREIVRIPTSGSEADKGTRFILHRGNLALLWCLINNINTIQILPRQNYKTISSVCFYLYQFLFATSNSSFTFAHKQLDGAEKNLKDLKDIREILPKWMQNEDKDDKNNIKYLLNNQTKNEILILSTGKNKEAADKLGRGLTTPNQWCNK
jgi:hypothetical protein